jgi:hypothetical protein
MTTSLGAVAFTKPRAAAPKVANGVPTLHRLVPFGETNEASAPSDAVLERRGGCLTKKQRSFAALGSVVLAPRAIWRYAGGATFAVDDIGPPRLKGGVNQDPAGKRGALRH